MSDHLQPPPQSGPSGDQPPGPGYWKASDGNWYPPQPPQQPQQYGQVPAAAPAGGMPGWAKGCLISTVVLVVLGLLGLGCVAIVADKASDGVSNALDEAERDLDRAIEESGSTEVEATTIPPFEGPEPTCSYTGTDDQLGYMEAELIFTNPLGEANDLDVTYALLDGENGTRFLTGKAGFVSHDLKFPRAYEQFRVSVDTMEEVPSSIDEATIDCSVLEIKENTNIGGYRRATDADTCAVVAVDSSGNIQVEMEVTSQYDETTSVQTWWALEAPGPVRFDGDTEVVDAVAAGETFQINPKYGTENPAWNEEGEVTCSVVGFWEHPGGG